MELNIRNFRDISGYINKNGKTMKQNMIFRGGALDRLSDVEADYFENQFGIKYILDFRDEKEANLSKDYSFEHVCYGRIGALQVKVHDEHGFDIASIMKAPMTKDTFMKVLEYVKEGYRNMAFDNEAYHKLFEWLLNDNGHVYFHCTAGKDRTGVAGFLIMMALGMDEEDAIQEYLLSNTYLKQGNDDLAKQLHIPEEYKKVCEPLLGVSRELIMMTIQSIKEKYASYEEFFEKEYGLGEGRLCTNLLKYIVNSKKN